MAKPKKIDYQKTYPTTYNYISALKAAFPQYKKYKHEDFFNLYDQIARVETNDQNIAQIGGGPGRGYYQVEGPSAKTAYARSQNIAKELEARGQKIKLPTFKEDFTQLDKDSQTFYITSNLIGAAAQKRKKDPNYYLDPTNPEKVWLELHWAGDPKDLPARQKRFREVNPVQKAQIEKAITPVTTERDVDWGNLLNTFIQTPTLLPAVLQANFGETPQKKNGGPVYNWIPEYPRTGAKYAQGGWLEKYADGSVVDIIKGSYINPFNWGVSDYSNVKNFSKAYEQAKKAGEEEFLWNGKRYNTKYAGTPRQEVGAYGVEGKPVNTKYINDPAQVNLYPPFGKYLPGHIAASIGDNQTAVDYRPKGNLPYGLDKVENKGEKSFNVYGQDNLTFSNKAASLPTGDYMLEDEYRPSDWNLFTNNCADNVCDAFGIPRSKGIQTPKGAMQKIQEKYPTLDVTGRTYEDYYDLSKKTSAIANMGTSAERKKLLTNYNNLIGIASSPDLESTKVSKNFGTALQVALKKEGYDLSNSIKSNGNFDGVIGPETLNALKDWQSKNAVNKKANGGTIEDQRIPTPTTPSYYPDYPDRTLTNYQMGTPKAPMYAAGSTVWTKQTTPTWVAGTPTPTTTQREINPSRTHSPGTAIPYPEIKITGPTNPYMPASPPVLQGYNPYNGPMRLHAPTTTKMAKHGGDIEKNVPGLRYQALNPGVSAPAGIYTGPTTQRGITFGNGGNVPPLYVSNPNDPRLKSYNDSLALFKSYGIAMNKLKKDLKAEGRSLKHIDIIPFKSSLFVDNYKDDKILPIGFSRDTEAVDFPEYTWTTPIYKQPVQPVIYQPTPPVRNKPATSSRSTYSKITKMPMRGISSVSTEEAMPQKVNVPNTTSLPTQYMDTRGEWSSAPQVPPVYTEEQLLKMGYRAPQKKANGGWLDSYNDGGEADLNKPYLNPATVQAVLAKANQPVTTTTGRVISTPASREKERREKIIAKDPSKYSVEDYKKGIQEPGADNSVLSDPLAMAAALTAGGVGLGAYGLSQVPRMFLGNLASEATAGLSNLGKFVTTKTPLKNAYKINPKALKEADLILTRTQKPGQSSDLKKLKELEKWGNKYGFENMNDFLFSDYKRLSRPGYGRGFSSSLMDIDYYTSPYIKQTRDYEGFSEILKIRLPAKEAAKFNVGKKPLQGYNSYAPNREYLLPEDLVYSAESFIPTVAAPYGPGTVHNFIKTLDIEQQIANTPHWWKGYPSKKNGGWLDNL